MPDELGALRTASKGLLYPSDTDMPFEVVSGLSVPAGAKVVSLDDFFAELKDSDDATKFEKLRGAIDASLRDPKVYRIDAKTQVDVYILGKLESGAIGGLKTASVET